MKRSMHDGLSLLTAVVSFALLPAPARAQGYSFDKIVDSADGFDPFEFGCPALNDGGAVAFRARRDTGSTGVFRGQGTELVLIADSQRDGLGFVGRHPSINDRGQVSFAANLRAGGEAILLGDGGPLTLVARTDPGPFNFFGFDTSLNAWGAVAFKAELDDFDEGLFVARRGPTATSHLRTVYLASTSPFLGDLSGPSINDRGAVAFFEFLDDFETGMFLATGGGFVTIADSTGPVDATGRPSLNNDGLVAFQAFRDDGEAGIFTGRGGPLTPIADSTGPFARFGFGDPSLNDPGLVAFNAALDSGEQGLFVGPDPVGDRVIVTGDPLDGSTVTNVIFCGEGLNDLGQLAFQAQLADGRTVVMVASPSGYRAR